MHMLRVQRNAHACWNESRTFDSKPNSRLLNATTATHVLINARTPERHYYTHVLIGSSVHKHHHKELVMRMLHLTSPGARRIQNPPQGKHAMTMGLMLPTQLPTTSSRYWLQRGAAPQSKEARLFAARMPEPDRFLPGRARPSLVRLR
jgi:hypothetical protein